MRNGDLMKIDLLSQLDEAIAQGDIGTIRRLWKELTPRKNIMDEINRIQVL